jgi:hypothetical protein
MPINEYLGKQVDFSDLDLRRMIVGDHIHHFPEGHVADERSKIFTNEQRWLKSDAI